MQLLYERTIGTLTTGRLIEGGRLIQGRYIQVRLLRLRVSNSYVWGLIFLRLAVINSSV